ncbi:uncharacterized protein LOC111252656 isoform X2 [Varroa destructor]|uniref:DUF4706 domain-containing protein n=1 Tax=Varroa destructor TaxID=109461 RepID=A0A7M7KJ12_VARDE|nr:uncharacterized protein LOC111252656 isoform X2 [Varroa destructor]
MHFGCASLIYRISFSGVRRGGGSLLKLSFEVAATSTTRIHEMSTKTSTATSSSSSSSSSDISKKVHSYFASLSCASARILDDVRSISTAHSRRQNHTFNSKTNSAKTSPGGWESLSEKERADLVIESLVPEDLEQKYRSLTGDSDTDTGSLAWSGSPLGPLTSFVDPSQTFPLIEINTGPPLASVVTVGDTLAPDTRGRSIVMEEDINGQKVPITWRDEHAQAFSWYNQSCDPITPSRDAADSAKNRESAQLRIPPPFVNLCGAEDVTACNALKSIIGDHQPPLARLSTSVSGTLDSGISNATSDGGVFASGNSEVSAGGGDRVSRRSSRASTPERRKSPLMRPKQAPPPPPAAVAYSQPNNQDINHKETPKETGGDRLWLGEVLASGDSAARQLSGRREMSASKESIASAQSSHNEPTNQALTGGSAFLQPPRSSSAQPATGKKRQAPKPPVSPVGSAPEPPERSSTLSLASVGSAASFASASSNPLSNTGRTGAGAKWPSQTERPRSSFCPSADPDQPHILPEALAPETARGTLEARASPLLQHSNSGLRAKVPPQQLKKVVPPVAPKFEPSRLGVKSLTESIISTPVINDDIPKTGFDFLDNW